MHYFEVAPTVLVRQGVDYFTYHHETKLDVGQLVLIEVGSKQTNGVVVGKSKKPDFPTKPIASTIQASPLPVQLVSLARWISEYYITPLATVLQTLLPSGINVKRRENQSTTPVYKRKRTKNVFNKEQLEAIDKIAKSDSPTTLLQGVTGSGKTEVYIESAKRSLVENKSVIVLVPEISLTPQLIAEFSAHFSNLFVTHSKMTPAQRHITWQKILESNQAVVVIGPRSALFAPVRNLGLVIIDECHETSYKQDSAPRYNTLRVAAVLSRLHGAKLVMGSATPNVADRYLADNTPGSLVKISRPAKLNARKPDIEVIDLSSKSTTVSQHWLFADSLVKAIEETVGAGNQAMIFHNRRGTANLTLCKDCGWTSQCPNCHLPLNLHADKYKLLCHICGHKASVPPNCPVCYNTDILHKGSGTKLIESELKRLFPKASVARFDTDNEAGEDMTKRYQEIYDGSVDIIVGTQTIAKGLDLPKLRLIGITQADSGLAMPDYSAEEKVFQLLAQVSGRVGRSDHKTRLIVQTFRPNSPAVAMGIKQDFEAFYKYTLDKRQADFYPPFCHLLKITCSYKTELACIKNTKILAQQIRLSSPKRVKILGPTPAFYERQFGKYRWQIIIKSSSRGDLVDIARSIQSKNWSYDIDPLSLL